MRYLVVGGGISGLAAAWELVQHVDGADVTLLDAGDRPGGKLRGESVGGVDVDVGAESVLARRPEALDLIHEVGLGDDHDALADRIVRLDADPTLRREIGRNGRAVAERRFSATGYVERLVALYSDLLARKRT